mgnify:FL=1
MEEQKTPNFETSRDYAMKMDQKDSLAKYRDRFYIPLNKIYLDGNSLGLLSKDSEQYINRIVDEWKTLGIKGWLDGKIPWFYYSEEMGELI